MERFFFLPPKDGGTAYFRQTLPTGTFLTSSTNTTSLRDHCSSFTFSSSFGAGVDRRRSETKKLLPKKDI